MKANILFLIFGTLGTLVGGLFKVMHWPGAMGMLLAGFTFFILGLITSLFNKKEKE